ncbi:MAG: metal-dependent hydrolase family protein [Acidimicrobiales bacterium]
MTPGPVVILVSGTRIAQVLVGGTLDIPTQAELIDTGASTLIPGLVDAHLHLTHFNVRTASRYRMGPFDTTPQLQMLLALRHAQMCMDMGFTTLRDAGGIGYTGLLTNELVALRDAFQRELLPGPRLVVAGLALTTGSHLEMLIAGNLPRSPSVTADGPWALREMVRAHVRAGVDFIKVCVSGGISDPAPATGRHLTQDELDAVVDEAHAHGLRCAAHAFTAETQKMAIRAGCDTLEHCVWSDSEAARMIVETNTILVPTLAHRTARAIELRRASGAPEHVLTKMEEVRPAALEAFRYLYQSGVRMAMGTDTSVDPEMGDNAQELGIYTSCGMSPAEAVATATGNAAAALGLEQRIGWLRPGFEADVVAVSGDLLADIHLLRDRCNILLVMKAGRVRVDRRTGQAVKEMAEYE